MSVFETLCFLMVSWFYMFAFVRKQGLLWKLFIVHFLLGYCCLQCNGLENPGLFTVNSNFRAKEIPSDLQKRFPCHWWWVYGTVLCHITNSIWKINLGQSLERWAIWTEYNWFMIGLVVDIREYCNEPLHSTNTRDFLNNTVTVVFLREIQYSEFMVTGMLQW